MSRYVDGYLLVLPKKNLAVYRKMAKVGCRVWTDHGALAYRETVGDDLASGFGLPFPKLCKAKKSETIVFAYVEFRSRAHRDRVNAAVMKDPRLAAMCGKTMPFDMKRMCVGGFEIAVSG